MRRTKEEALQTRENVLKAALDIFSSNSYSDVSLTQIAEAVNMSKGVVYWHFKNKADLLEKLIIEIENRATGYIVERLGAPHTLDDVREYYKAFIPKDRYWDNVSKLMLRRHEWPPEICAHMKGQEVGRFDMEVAVIEKLLKEEQEKNEIRSDLDLRETAELIVGVFNGLFALRFHGIIPDIPERRIDFIFDAFDAAIRKK